MWHKVADAPVWAINVSADGTRVVAGMGDGTVHWYDATSGVELCAVFIEPETGRWVLVSTAHPAKFSEIVAPLIGREVPVPETLARLFARPTRCVEIDATLAALRAALLTGG